MQGRANKVELGAEHTNPTSCAGQTGRWEQSCLHFSPQHGFSSGSIPDIKTQCFDSRSYNGDRQLDGLLTELFRQSLGLVLLEYRVNGAYRVIRDVQLNLGLSTGAQPTKQFTVHRDAFFNAWKPGWEP